MSDGLGDDLAYFVLKQRKYGQPLLLRGELVGEVYLWKYFRATTRNISWVTWYGRTPKTPVDLLSFLMSHPHLLLPVRTRGYLALRQLRELAVRQANPDQRWLSLD